MKTLVKYIIPILLTFLSACATLDGTPTSPLDSSEGKEVLKQYTKDFIDQAALDVNSKETRNTLTSKALIIMDTNYAEFINGTENARKNKDMLADFVELSMNLSGAAVGSAGTKTILAAISAGVNGINGSIDKNYFYDKTFPSLVARMNADRKIVRARISKSMLADINDYPWHIAINDLVEYYNAGTLFGAISSIQKLAGNDEHQADMKIEKYREISLESIVTEETRLLFSKLKTALKQFNDPNYDASKLAKLKSNLIPALKNDLTHVADCNSMDATALTTALEVGNALWKCQQGAGDITRKANERKADLETIEKYYVTADLLNN